jgi:phosphopantothenoylcysteine synthetase/decarboxylase
LETYKKLKSRWYKKLRDSGFNDIENEDGSLKAEVDPRTVANAMNTKESRVEYYEKATEFLATYKGFTAEQRKIWSLHCTGLGAIKIARQLEITLYKADSTLTKLKTLAKLGAKR